jgi:hypothetical protein
MISMFRPVRHGAALRTTLSMCLATGLALAPHAALADAQTVKLIQLLIQKGILTPNQAKDLLSESAAPGGARHKHTAAAAPALEEPEAEAPPVPSGQIRVTYVPQFVRKQIADEVRAQVMDQAQQEGWAAPDALPEWTKRIKIFGDIRVRYEDDLFDKDNYNQFVNFNSINNGSAFDANLYANGNGPPPPFLDTTQDRYRFRLRARLGAEAEIDDWVTAVIRVGTGQDDGPVSPNQTLGTGNSALGAAGDFAKPGLWLDRGYVKLTPIPQLTLYAGRMDSPFLDSDLMFYPFLGFDGFAAKFTQPVGGGITLFANGGAFPLFNTAFDFSTYSDEKFASTNAYLTAIQAGATWRINQQLNASLGIGIFDFLGVQGAVSAPCAEQIGGGFYCNTDDTRTPFEQFGNTLYPIRNIIPTSFPITPTTPDPQYYGLASRFNVLDIHPRLNILTYDPIDVALEGEFTKNLAFNRAAILLHGPTYEPDGPVNNLGNNGAYQGGDTGYMLKATVGQFEMKQRWDWNVFLSYRYLQSDATLDAIADFEFHQGGTNAQGYILGGNLGIARNTWLNLKWLSAQAVSGPHYGTDTLFLDLNTRF